MTNREPVVSPVLDVDGLSRVWLSPVLLFSSSTAAVSLPGLRLRFSSSCSSRLSTGVSPSPSSASSPLSLSCTSSPLPPSSGSFPSPPSSLYATFSPPQLGQEVFFLDGGQENLLERDVKEREGRRFSLKLVRSPKKSGHAGGGSDPIEWLLGDDSAETSNRTNTPSTSQEKGATGPLKNEEDESRRGGWGAERPTATSSTTTTTAGASSRSAAVAEGREGNESEEEEEREYGSRITREEKRADRVLTAPGSRYDSLRGGSQVGGRHDGEGRCNGDESGRADRQRERGSGETVAPHVSPSLSSSSCSQEVSSGCQDGPRRTGVGEGENKTEDKHESWLEGANLRLTPAGGREGKSSDVSHPSFLAKEEREERVAKQATLETSERTAGGGGGGGSWKPAVVGGAFAQLSRVMKRMTSVGGGGGGGDEQPQGVSGSFSEGGNPSSSSSSSFSEKRGTLLAQDASEGVKGYERQGRRGVSGREEEDERARRGGGGGDGGHGAPDSSQSFSFSSSSPRLVNIRLVGRREGGRGEEEEIEGSEDRRSGGETRVALPTGDAKWERASDLFRAAVTCHLEVLCRYAPLPSRQTCT